jgi:Tol biopolymer transport system component
MNSLKLLLIFLLIIPLFSDCKKNPVDNQIEDPIELKEERILLQRGSRSLGYTEFGSMRPDGSDLQSIRHNIGASSARWSPDKSKIVLQGDTVVIMDTSPIWIMDMNGQLLNCLTRNGFNPLWSHNGDRIIYQDYCQGIGKRLYSINIDGTDEEIIYQVGDSTHFYLSDISASGEYILGYESILYKNDEGGISYTDFEIVKVNLHTGEKVYLTDNDLSDGPARFNYNETKIAYICRDVKGHGSENDIYNIYIMNSDGSNKIRVTNETMPNSFVGPFIAWSPDGSKIVYQKLTQRISYFGDITDIFVVDILTGNSTKLTNALKDSTYNHILDWK